MLFPIRKNNRQFYKICLHVYNYKNKNNWKADFEEERKDNKFRYFFTKMNENNLAYFCEPEHS